MVLEIIMIYNRETSLYNIPIIRYSHQKIHKKRAAYIISNSAF